MKNASSPLAKPELYIVGETHSDPECAEFRAKVRQLSTQGQLTVLLENKQFRSEDCSTSSIGIGIIETDLLGLLATTLYYIKKFLLTESFNTESNKKSFLTNYGYHLIKSLQLPRNSDYLMKSVQESIHSHNKKDSSIAINQLLDLAKKLYNSKIDEVIFNNNNFFSSEALKLLENNIQPYRLFTVDIMYRIVDAIQKVSQLPDVIKNHPSMSNHAVNQLDQSNFTNLTPNYCALSIDIRNESYIYNLGIITSRVKNDAVLIVGDRHLDGLKKGIDNTSWNKHVDVRFYPKPNKLDLSKYALAPLEGTPQTEGTLPRKT